MWNIFNASQNNIDNSFLNKPIAGNLETLSLIPLTSILVSLATQNLDYTRKTYHINKANLEISTQNKEANVARLALDEEKQKQNNDILIELTKAINLLNEKNSIIIEQNQKILSLLSRGNE